MKTPRVGSLFRKTSSFQTWAVFALGCSLSGSLSAATFGKFTYIDNGTSITITGYPTTEVGVVDIPSTIDNKPVTSIGTQAFYGCGGLTSVSMPSSVISIGPSAFFSCTHLTSVTIPSGVTSIGPSAFLNCYRLTGMTIPSSVTSIGLNAFALCNQLTFLNVDAANPNYSSLDGVFFNKLQTNLIQYPAGKSATVYAIPSSVTSIGNTAFIYSSSLTSVTIPSSVISIGNSAFTYCVNLASVTIPSSVTSIGGSAFFQCNGLQFFSVDVANPNYSSLDGVFFNKSQTSLIQYPASKNRLAYAIPATVTSIRDSAFNNCSGLTGVTIPSSVTSIGSYAFEGCVNLTSVTIPSSVLSIESSAFLNCVGLTGVYFQGNAPSPDSSSIFSNATNLTVYYLSTATGWGSTFGGRPTVPISALNMFHLSSGLPSDGTGDFLTPAGDGVPNLYKYAFNMIGGGPGQASTLDIPNNQRVGSTGTAGLPLSEYQVNSDSRLKWTYIRRKASTSPGITYIVEFTDDLGSPSWATNPLATETPVSIDATFERVTVTDSVANASKRFSRVRVTSP